MPATKPDPRDEMSNREKQKAHGAASDQGGNAQTGDAPKPEPRVYEGAEESNQQRRS